MPRAPALPTASRCCRRLALADMVAGLYGAFAVMVALRQVEVEGGNGQVIDLPLLDPLFSFIATEARDLPAHRRDPAAHRQPLGDDLAAQRLPHQGRPLYRHLRLDPGDGRAAVPRDRPRRHDRRPALPHQHRPGAATPRNARRRSSRSSRRARSTRTWPSSRRAEVTAAPVYDIDQFLADPHVQAREIVVDLPDDEMGTRADAQRHPAPVRHPRPTPHAGAGARRAHRRILGELGLDAADARRGSRRRASSGSDRRSKT